MKARRWSVLAGERLALGARRYLTAWLAVAKHLGIFPIISPARANQFAQRILCAQDDICYGSKVIPAREAWELFPGLESVDVTLGCIFPDEGSSVSVREMIVLCSLMKIEKPRKVFEIGTSLGVTAFNLALNLPDDGMLYTLDLPPVGKAANEIEIRYDVSVSDRKMIFAGREQRRFLNSAVQSKIVQLYGDSAAFDYSTYEGSCDLVLVDGAHSLDYVRSDSEVALRLVKPGGLVVWHDYNDGFFWPAVHRHLESLGEQLSISRIKGTMLAVTRGEKFDHGRAS